jgi:hypothetical protein
MPGAVLPCPASLTRSRLDVAATVVPQHGFDLNMLQGLHGP